jgi:hypothetical protein
MGTPRMRRREYIRQIGIEKEGSEYQDGTFEVEIFNFGLGAIISDIGVLFKHIGTAPI